MGNGNLNGHVRGTRATGQRPIFVTEGSEDTAFKIAAQTPLEIAVEDFQMQQQSVDPSASQQRRSLTPRKMFSRTLLLVSAMLHSYLQPSVSAAPVDLQNYGPNLRYIFSLCVLIYLHLPHSPTPPQSH